MHLQNCLFILNSTSRLKGFFHSFKCIANVTCADLNCTEWYNTAFKLTHCKCFALTKQWLVDPVHAVYAELQKNSSFCCVLFFIRDGCLPLHVSLIKKPLCYRTFIHASFQIEQECCLFRREKGEYLGKKSGSTVYATHMLQIIQSLGMRLTDINLRSSTAVRVKFPVSKSTIIVQFLRGANFNLSL